MKNKIGYAYVVGDILHFGHIQHLKNCRALCDKLIVGVLTDKATMEKKLKPIIPFKERLELVGELKSVDAVVAQEEYSPFDNVVSIEPDILFESTSHEEGEAHYCRVIKMPYFPEQSSSKIKQTVKNEWTKGDK